MNDVLYTLNVSLVAEKSLLGQSVVHTTYPFKSKRKAMNTLRAIEAKIGVDKRNDPEALRHRIVHDCGECVILTANVFIVDVSEEVSVAEWRARLNSIRDGAGFVPAEKDTPQ